MTTTPPAAELGKTPETGIAADDMYRMSKAFCGHVHRLRLSINALRLLHALLHATCRDLPRWSTCAMQPAEGLRRPSLALRRVLGLETANGNRDLTAGAKELRGSGLFDMIGYAHGHTWLCWRLTDDALAFIFDDRRYGLFDARHLPSLRTITDFTMHSELAVVRRMRRGVFELHLDSAPGGRTWATGSRTIMTALRRGAGLQRLLLVVFLDCEGVMRGIDTMHVRAWRPGCTWTIRDLAKLNASTRRCLFVDGAGHVEVPIGALRGSLQKVAEDGWSLDALRGR